MTRGFTFIDVLVGTSLIVIVFLGIFGAYLLGFGVIAKSKARITATALANQKIEFARNISYNDVGTVGGVPAGTIPETEIITRNGISYTTKTTVTYIDDDFDGAAPIDALPNDYKRVRIKVSWSEKFSGEVILATDISPKGLETSVGGGNLLLSVFDAFGAGIPQADIRVVNNSTSPPIDTNYQTNNEGRILVAGAPASIQSYEITVSKSGYSTDRTYGVEEVATPLKPHATVMEGKLTETSFSIDRLGAFSVETVSSSGKGNFFDSFVNDSKISDSLNILIFGGNVTLATTTAPATQYETSGYVVSSTISPTNLTTWDEFKWNDSAPADTTIKYQLLYFSDPNWLPIPDADLAGNVSGFDSSLEEIDLSGLSTSTYSGIRARSNLATSNASTTPTLFDWEVLWDTSEGNKIGNAQFRLRGSKIIGTDAQENPVYKHSQNHTTGSDGRLNITNLEWDSYTFSVDPITGLDLAGTAPSPQPISLAPDASQSVDLILSSSDSLLVRVRDADTLEPIFSAQVRLFNIGLGYDQAQLTDIYGETLFIPIESVLYGWEAEVAGYQNNSGSTNVSGDSIQVINLTPGEI